MTGHVESARTDVPSVARAGRADGDATARRVRVLTLPADARDTPHRARRLAVETLSRWQLHGLTDDVRLCVSELVGNAVRHAIGRGGARPPGHRAAVTVTLRLLPEWLVVEVADEDPTPPHLPPPDDVPTDGAEWPPEALWTNHGRGLRIVRTLADAVWWSPWVAGGKRVACRFAVDAVPPRRP